METQGREKAAYTEKCEGESRTFVEAGDIMFMGEYSHTIDAKGRLIVPVKFREILGEEFVLTKGLDGCLYIYPMESWITFEKKLRDLPLTNKNARTLTRFFVSGAVMCSLDRQGRILVPQTLREFACLKKDVILAGNLERIEIWDKEKWSDNCDYDDMDSIAEEMEKLGICI